MHICIYNLQGTCMGRARTLEPGPEPRAAGLGPAWDQDWTLPGSGPRSALGSVSPGELGLGAHSPSSQTVGSLPNTGLT